MSFSKYVSEETVVRAGFNWHEPSWPIKWHGRNFTVYHTKYPRKPEPNLVVIESFEDPEELYFRAFPGRYPGECDTAEEAAPFFEEVYRTVSYEFRIDGRKLEKKILETVKAIEKRNFSY